MCTFFFFFIMRKSVTDMSVTDSSTSITVLNILTEKHTLKANHHILGSNDFVQVVDWILQIVIKVYKNLVDVVKFSVTSLQKIGNSLWWTVANT